MDFQHQYYLSNDFNQKIIKLLNKIDDIEDSKKIVDEIFNYLYPAINKFINYKKIKNPDIISDYILQIYENFPAFLAKAKSFLKDIDNFVFYYYFLKNLYFEWQNFNRTIKTSKNINENNKIEYLDSLKNEDNIIASSKSKIDEINQIIKRCLYNHFEKEEIVMFLTYYYFLIEKEDYIFISDFLKIPILNLIDLIDKNQESESTEKSAKTLDDKIIERLFNQTISSFRVNISRIKKKMKIKCNYLLENYLFIDEGEI